MMEDPETGGRPARARYDKARHHLERRWRRRPERHCDRMMRAIVDELWAQFGADTYSWCGFYLLSPDGSRWAQGHCQPRPGPETLPLDGPRGRAAQGSVIDAGEGGGSRICVPVLDQRGEAWAMLAVESARAGAFNEVDRRWLERMLKALAQLPRPSSP